MYSPGDRMRLCRHTQVVKVDRRRRESAGNGNVMLPASFTSPIYQCLSCGLVGDKGEALYANEKQYQHII